jgi:hypothetical protein
MLKFAAKSAKNGLPLAVCSCFAAPSRLSGSVRISKAGSACALASRALTHSCRRQFWRRSARNHATSENPFARQAILALSFDIAAMLRKLFLRTEAQEPIRIHESRNSKPWDFARRHAKPASRASAPAAVSSRALIDAAGFLPGLATLCPQHATRRKMLARQAILMISFDMPEMLMILF